ncbi:uncharacterized protein LOC103313573 isoform X1 [Tribolium castaneum]|uniref:uncharacterized protein LOC103313573 isoform X1 n=1 Tax=Tribolium castaneum TaxID=7070 RepID=UPI00077DDBE4|nr:PREDICTED: uncharacterized protein LOC103313573 isoform X1 [Tribolium castaneum]XP_015837030.1 PREDICTED: uncharacterized protein LOC103313573 isoform X1 [Tribolium castaneum]XP_015837031.1 PREDICTED: uncharacterized protein LOC103313573 isoform X1 [Tribolium castaneum]|eukprot:XP_015837029.1 PREDICTED: uncharacterized protein LOC103313573 isoform X1 [Tribolium castaneum]
MWHLLVINLIFEFIYPNSVKSAWVEIPQVPNKKPPQFIFGNTKKTNIQNSQLFAGSPKVSFHDKKFSTTTTPANYKMLKATPKMHSTTTPNYKDLMTTIQPLTTTPQINKRMDLKTENTLKAPEEFTEAPKQINKTKSKTEETNSGFMPLLNTIQQTLTHNAKKSLKSKISLLTNLRDNLLANIDERMGSLWRSSDDDLVEARGHDHEMDFPSNEGALMTIGFLTFAVFLIKLVLKLIQALKNKTNNGTMMNGGTTATAFIGRKRRQLEDEYDNLKILQFIEDYKFG